MAFNIIYIQANNTYIIFPQAGHAAPQITAGFLYIVRNKKNKNHENIKLIF